MRHEMSERFTIQLTEDKKLLPNWFGGGGVGEVHLNAFFRQSIMGVISFLWTNILISQR